MSYPCNSRGILNNKNIPGSECCKLPLHSPENPNGIYYTATENCTGLKQPLKTAATSVNNNNNNNPSPTSVAGYVQSTKNIHDKFQNIEQFFQQTLPSLNTGLSDHTEKIIFFGLPFVLFIAILISILVLIGLSIDNGLKN